MGGGREEVGGRRREVGERRWDVGGGVWEGRCERGRWEVERGDVGYRWEVGCCYCYDGEI